MSRKVALRKWVREWERQSQTAVQDLEQLIPRLVRTTTCIGTPRETSLLDLQGIPCTTSQQHSGLTPKQGSSFETAAARGVLPQSGDINAENLFQIFGRSLWLKRPSLVALLSKSAPAKLEKPSLGCKADGLFTSTKVSAFQNTISQNSVTQSAASPKCHNVAFSRRWLHTVSDASVKGQKEPWPVEIKVQKKGKALEVAFADGQRFIYSAELLRVESPSADNRRKDQTGATRLVSGRKHVSILGVEPVGNYALRITFDDLHENGIYTWRYLHDLGKKKYSCSKAYIKHLRERGLSREPKRL